MPTIIFDFQPALATHDRLPSTRYGELLSTHAHTDVRCDNPRRYLNGHWRVGTTRDGQCSWFCQHSSYKDTVMEHVDTVRLREGIVGASHVLRRRAVPIYKFVLFYDRGHCARLVGLYIRLVKVPPGIVWHSRCPLGGAVVTMIGGVWSDVMRFTIV